MKDKFTSKMIPTVFFFHDLSLIIVFLHYLKLHSKQQVFVHLEKFINNACTILLSVNHLSGGFDIF